MERLLDAYKRILQEVDAQSFNLNEDKYSGVFLPVPFEEYWHSPVKIMLVGRETAGWNTLNGKNTISRVLGLIPDVTIGQVVEEAVDRYRKHLPVQNDGTPTSNHVAASRNIISGWPGSLIFLLRLSCMPIYWRGITTD